MGGLRLLLFFVQWAKTQKIRLILNLFERGIEDWVVQGKASQNQLQKRMYQKEGILADGQE